MSRLQHRNQQGPRDQAETEMYKAPHHEPQPWNPPEVDHV